TPPDPFTFLLATLTPGTTIIFKACQDVGCSVELAGTLSFVNPGGNGCLGSVAGVTSCAEDPIHPNRVGLVTGVRGSLPPLRPPSPFHTSQINLAALRFRAVTPAPGSGTFFLSVATANNQILGSFARCCDSMATNCVSTPCTTNADCPDSANPVCTTAS